MHIPLPEYMELSNNHEFYGNKNEFIACGSVNTGLFSAIIEQPTLEWVLCGHDHNNDFYGKHQGIYLGFGRKTGYGGYGPSGFNRGARVFEISLNPIYKIETWIRDETGAIEISKKNRRDLFDPIQRNCGALVPYENDYNQWFITLALVNVGFLLIAEAYSIYRIDAKVLF